MMMTDCDNQKHVQFNSTDRLSDLPDFIMHHIISYLDTKEAYRTSVLSKRWNQIFATNPILDFYHPAFPSLSENIDTRMQKISKENLRIKTLRLSYSATELLLACKVDEWLEIAVLNHVAKIVLEGPVKYKLPRILFCAKSLRHLDIAHVEIPYYEAVDLVSLESLVLLGVVVEERMLFHIISSCLLLKELVLSYCSGFKNIVIPRRSKLESFQYDTNWSHFYIDEDVHVDGRVILETSTLRSFQYDTNGVNPWWPIISNRGLLTNLRFLSIADLSITGEDLAKLLLELTSLEKLVFIGCQMRTSIKISHTQLRKISFYNLESLSNIVIDAPNLIKFKFDDIRIKPPVSITIRSQANCNIHVRSSAYYFDTNGFFMLKKLLKGLNSCNVLKIFLFRRSFESRDEEESGNAELGPPCDIRELKLDLSYWESSSSSLSAFLNGLFRTCHPPIISLRVKPGHHKLKVEPLVNKLVNMVKCLSHPLKRIEVGETNSDSDFLDVQLKLCW